MKYATSRVGAFLSPAESEAEPDSKQEAHERTHFAMTVAQDTPPRRGSMDLNSHFKGANARFRRTIKDKLKEKKPKVNAMMQKVKRLKDFGDTSDGGESED